MSGIEGVGGAPAGYEHGRGEDPEQVNHAWTHIGFTTEARAVCQDCNNGWMANLDAEAEPIVCALMRGRTLILDVRGQRLLAAWGLKIAMMTEFTHRAEARRIPPIHRQHLAKNRGLPENTAMFLAAYGAGHWVGWSHYQIFEIEGDPKPGAVAGYFLTFTLGRLAFQVMGYDFSRARPPVVAPKARRRVYQLWPRTGLTLACPPAPLATDRELFEFAGSFGHLGLLVP